jgi:hypothetical protein
VSEAGVLVHNQNTFYLPPVTGAGMSLDPNTGFGSLVSGASDFIRENPTLDTILDKFGIATPIHAFGDAHKDLVKFETLSALKNVAIGVASLPIKGNGGGAGKPPVIRVDKAKNGKSNSLSPNQMNQQIKTGKAPYGIKRVDTPKVANEKLHVTFEDNSALNKDGIWKHNKNNYKITNEQKKWLEQNGWTIPTD